MHHLRTDNEDDALLDVCRKLGVSVPALATITAKDLMEKEFPPLVELIEGMLAPGLYLLAGAPKIGKSWLVLQIAHHISTGTPLWNRKVMQYEVLYLSLEDTLPRIQRRLMTICDGETGNVVFATEVGMLGDGFEKQLTSYLNSNADTKVVIIDTLAKVRGVVSSSNVYSSDYAAMNIFKHFADKYKIALILVHHTRKQDADDTMQKISGTNGLMGAADGAFVLSKDKRTSNNATLDVAGRDQQDMKIHLVRDSERLVWNFAKSETEMWKEPPEPLLEKIADTLFSESDRWEGTASELCERLAVDIKPNVLSLRLSINASRLFRDYGIRYQNSRTHDGRKVSLWKETEQTA